MNEAERHRYLLGTEFPDAVEAMVTRAESLDEIRWINRIFHDALNALHWKTQLELSKAQSDRSEQVKGVVDREEAVRAYPRFPKGPEDAVERLRAAHRDQDLPPDGTPSDGPQPKSLSGGGG